MPQISLPADYCLRRVKHDYPDYRRALAREFIQNSVDAGATRIDFEFQHHADGSLVIVVQDNGRGASRDVIENKLLVFGVSGKDGEAGAVGGFGLAKELLFLAWPRWEIATGTTQVRGNACSYEIEGCPSASGFRATIHVPASESPELFEPALRKFVRDCSLPECAVYTRSSKGGNWTGPAEIVMQGRELPGRASRDFKWGKLYREPSDYHSDITIRAGGVAMFRVYSGHDRDAGRFTVELTGRSINLLTAGRNAFKDRAHERDVLNFVAALRTDKRAALRPPTIEDVIVFLDDGEPALQALLAGGKEGEIPGQPGTVLPSAGAPGNLAGPGTAVSGGHLPRLGVQRIETGDGSRIMAEVARLSTFTRKDRLARAEVPDYGVPRFVLHTRGQLKKVREFLVTPRAKQVAKGWEAACTAVLVAAGMKRDGIGFTFLDDVEAECVKTEQRTALLIQPRKVPRSFTSEDLIDVAIHEVAHLSTGTGHSESWATKEMEIRRALRPSYATARRNVEAALRGAK